MTRPRAYLAAAVALVLATSTACISSHKNPVSAPTTITGSVPPGSPSYAALQGALIDAADISVDKFTQTDVLPVQPQMGAEGISAVYANAGKDRVLSVILLHFPTVAYAQAGLPEIQSLAAARLTRNPASDTTVKVGTGAHLYQGADAAGPLTILVFEEGSYVVSMQYVSKRANDNIPSSLAVSLGTKQDARVKAIK